MGSPRTFPPEFNRMEPGIGSEPLDLLLELLPVQFTLVHKHSYTVWARGLSSDGGVGFNLSSATVVIDNKYPSQTGEGLLLIAGPAFSDQ